MVQKLRYAFIASTISGNIEQIKITYKLCRCRLGCDELTRAHCQARNQRKTSEKNVVESWSRPQRVDRSIIFRCPVLTESRMQACKCPVDRGIFIFGASLSSQIRVSGGDQSTSYRSRRWKCPESTQSKHAACKPNMAGEMAPIIPMTNPIHVMAFVWSIRSASWF